MYSALNTLSEYTCFYTVFEIQVLSMLAIEFPGKFRTFLFASPMCQQKNRWRLSRNLCISRRQWLWHSSAFCQRLWFVFLTVDTTYFTGIILFTYNSLEQMKWRTIFLCRSPCSAFFVCPFYNRRTHFPTLENPGAQNKAACENQGKQCELSDHWKSIKCCFWKKKLTGHDEKKTNWNTSFYKKVYKTSQLFKPINYLKIASNTWSN